MKKLHITKKLFMIAFPIMLQFLAQFMLSLTDTAFIGNYQKEGLSAITSALVPYFMFLSFLFAIAQGATILIAQNLGANKPQEAKRIAEVAFFFNQIFSLIYLFFWIFFGKEVLVLVGLKAEILEMSWAYLRIISLHFLFFGFTLSAQSIFEGIGNTTPILITTLIRVFSNIILDWIMIFGKFGFPEMGIEGAALATLISQFIGTIAIVVMSFIFNKEFQITIRGILKPRLSIYLKSLRLGIPAGLEFVLYSAGETFLIIILNHLDNMYSGIFGIFTLLIQFSMYIYIGISVASLNLIGKATGAQKWHEGHTTGNLSILYGIFVCVMVGFIYVLFPRHVLGIFSRDTGILDNFYQLVYVAAIIAFPKCINIIVGSSIRGYGNTKWMLYTQIPGTVLKICLVYLFISACGLGISGVFIAIFIDEFLRAVINYIKYSNIFNYAKSMAN